MEQTNQKPLQEEKKKRSAGRIAGLAAGIAVGVLAAAYIAVCAAAAAGGTTLRGTQVLGVDVAALRRSRSGTNGSGRAMPPAGRRPST